QTVQDLAAHLLDTQAEALGRHFGRGTSAEPADVPAEPTPPRQDPPAAAVIAPIDRPATAADDGAVAVVGIAGIYPQANDLAQFWRNLAGGQDCIVEIPPDRWALEGFYDPDRARPETSYSKWGGFIDGVDLFDARFFNISPREADALDPQARKFLEVAWATMEDAGLTRDTLFHGDPDPSARLCGVFVGVMYGDYQLFGPEEAARGNLIAPNAAYWNIANRVSHFLDLHGPSMAVDTACSSSLSAIHTAIAALRNGDCTIAFAGGVNVTVHPGKHWILSKSGFASSDGRCRSFGEGGDGYVPGEGVGAVLLKPLARALADGDRIHAIIRSSAVNHGGRTNGYTVPNPVAQGSLIAAALRRGGIAPETIDYVEAHGTGTALGDPVEIAGLARAFSGAPAGSIAVGSVKSNIGHLESAAGIAALTKVVLQLRHRALAPSLHADRLNPNLKLETTPFVIQRGLAPWPAQANRPRRAGISSFGAGGANAHLVIEEAPHQPLDPPWEDGPLLVPLSAATPEALIRLATILADWLDENGAEADFASIARTLQTGREAMRHRLVVTASSAADLARLLRRFAANKAVAPPPEVAEWVAGGRFDWDAMAPGPRRPVSLPTYPFAQRRCWVELTAAAAGLPAAVPTVGSTSAIPCTVSDPLVADHRLGGDLVLAGAFLLNAAREAAGGVAPAMADISFRRPVTPSMAPLAAIEPDGRLAIRVDGADHATGRLLADAGVRPDPLDLAAIAERCAEELAHDAVYGALASGGVAYGPAYRMLDTVWRGDGEALAELRPIDSVVGWAPNLLDAAFQVSFAVATAAGGLAPFAIDRIAAWGELGTATHVHAQRREAGADFMRLDLRVTDEDGAVLLAIDGFVARRPAPVLPLRLLEPEWRRSDAIGTSLRTGRAVIVGDGFDLATAWPDATLTSADAVPADASQVWYVAPRGLDEAGTILPFLGLLRSLADRPAAPAVTVVVTCAHRVMPADIPDPSAAALAAFALSAGREHPDLRLRVIDADAGADAEALLHLPAEAPLTALRKGVAHTRVLAETILPAAPAEPWRRGGVYLIAGGAGGIGLALAEHLVRSAGARVALLGRRAADAALSERMAALGPDVMYVQADVTDSTALRHAIATVTARLGPINGAFHLALAMHDARAVTLTEPQLRSVLAPKADGTRALMAALRDMPLDALMLFSSSNALTTNPGQSAYAAASAAQDAIGLGPAPWPVKIIDWGFWGEVGRVATPAYHASLARIGVYPIATREGLATIEQMLAAPQSQIVPLRISDPVAAALGVRPPGALQNIVGAVAPRAAGAVQMLAEAAKAFGAVDTYAAGLLLLAIQGMGGLTEAGASAGEDFPAMLGVQPRFARLFDALQDMLHRAGFLARDGSSFVATEAVTQPRATRTADLVQRRAGWIAEQPQVAPYLDLLDACATRLPDILRGTVDANDVLFPGGSSHLVEPIYRGNQVVDHFQTIVADATVAAVQARLRDLPPETPVRILEIGAGTGGTTAFVLPALKSLANRVRYVFTDVGRMFLDAARARFDEYGFLSVEHLDIEQPPATQGFPTHGFDIVIAANVLHATRDIARTLAQVRVLCRKGGILLLNEATARQDFNTMTFGLTRGWWLFQDAERRIAHAPLLSVSAWQDALSAHGFAPSQVLAGGDGAMQAVIAAEGDGAGDAAISQPVGTPTDARPTPAATSAGNGIPAIEATLRATVAKSLRLTPEEVEADTSFSDYGADSIISVDLVREINAALGIELKTTALFNYSTVRTLAGYIASEYADRFTAVAEAPPKPVSRARERSERLREIIRKRRDGLTFAPPRDPPPAVAPLVPPPAQSAATPLDDEAALFSLLQRLQAGEIDVAKALAETGDD
ncbi:MAG: SDR family NAD(P)-dependent oxidoreductase, partial [Acetobacteraceae bacterium]